MDFLKSCNKAEKVSRPHGAAIIEFSLILPILIILFLGTVEAGVALYDKAVITSAAREGARVGVLSRAPGAAPVDVEVFVRNYCLEKLVSLSPDSSSTPVVVSTATESFDGRSRGLLRVSVSYSFSGFMLAPLLSAFSAPITLSSQAVMRYE